MVRRLGGSKVRRFEVRFSHVRGRLRRRSIRAVRAVGRLFYTKAGRIVTKKSNRPIRIPPAPRAFDLPCAGMLNLLLK